MITRFKFLHVVSTITLKESHVLATQGYFLFSREAVCFTVPFFMLFPLLGIVFRLPLPTGKSLFLPPPFPERINPSHLWASRSTLFIPLLQSLSYCFVYYFRCLYPMLGCEVFEDREYVSLIFLLASSSAWYKIVFSNYLN